MAAGWFGSASVLGGYGQQAQDGYVGPAALTAAKVWAVGIPTALVLRGLLKGYPTPTPFVIVALGATAVLMLGWRSALAGATTPWVWLSELLPVTEKVAVCRRGLVTQRYTKRTCIGADMQGPGGQSCIWYHSRSDARAGFQCSESMRLCRNSSHLCSGSEGRKTRRETRESSCSC